MEGLDTVLRLYLEHLGIGGAASEWGSRLLLAAGILFAARFASALFRRLVAPALQSITARTRATWDDDLFNDRMMRSTGRLVRPVVWYLLLPFAFGDMPRLLDVLEKGCLVYLIVAALLLVRVFLDTLYEISARHETLRDRPLKGIYQMVNLLAAGVGGVLIVAILIGQNATSILAGLGASAAVLMLIFRDSILGLVAGVQLSANDMLRPGDWITMTKYGADGYVTEVTLTTVKVQNFDKTITTIPPYAMVSDSFQNWRGMRESGGRRIKRSLSVDAATVRFLSDAELDALGAEGLWRGNGTPSGKVVNLYALRAYIMEYLNGHPGVHPDLLRMARMLQPTSEGIPVEVYCFSREVEWCAYERLQGELFDHLLAVLPRFGLRFYQRPSGADIAPLRGE